MKNRKWESVFTSAKQVRARSHSPYSNFSVGATIVGADGTMFSGCNVENISYGLTICAERNALFHAIASGTSNFTHIGIVADTTTPVAPCGACRQVMAEFGELVVRSYNLKGEFVESPLSELLPRSSDGILEAPPAN